MAYGPTETLTLHAAGGKIPTVARARNILTPLDYAYNIAAFVELTDQGYVTDKQLEVGYKILQDAAVTEIASASHALGSLFDEHAQLILRRVETGSPITFTIDGIAKIIKELRSSFGPTYRNARKEELRHKREMNLLKEAQLRIGVERQFDDYLAESPRFNKARLSQEIGGNRANQVNYELTSEWTRAIEMLRAEDVETDPEDDE